jgi:hypothetical protein
MKKIANRFNAGLHDHGLTVDLIIYVHFLILGHVCGLFLIVIVQMQDTEGMCYSGCPHVVVAASTLVDQSETWEFQQ